MAVQVSFPGVYIEEFTPGAPITGVGTSTVAFLGPARDGPLNEPTKVTSWDAFQEKFGSEPLNGFYLWYAVRGFFENNGQICYVGRVSNGAFDFVELADRSAGAGRKTIRLQARVPGDQSARPLNVAVTEANAVTTRLFRPTADVKSASGSVIEVTSASDAAKFRPGDAIVISGGGNSDPATVLRVEDALIRLVNSLSHTFVQTPVSSPTVRLASLKAGVDDTFRVESGKELVSGSVIKLSQLPGGGTEAIQTVKSVDAERISSTLTTYRVVVKNPLSKDFDLSGDVNVESQEFKLKITQSSDNYEKEYNNLSMDPGHPRYFATVINNDPLGRITATTIEPQTTPAPDNRPRNTPAGGSALAGGSNDSPETLNAQDYKSALKQLEAIDDVNMVAIPDSSDADVQLALISHCERMQDRFAILDSRRSLPLFGAGSVEEQRRGLDSASGYAALYYPWLVVTHASGRGRVTVPPSGHVAGIYARTDTKRGVHKAPAGEEALLNGVLGLERTMSDIDQGQLNTQGINVVRVFKEGGRSMIWGARTTATNASWQYVNVRRLFLFLEESIEEGIRWAVFEPNNLSLWQKLKRSITAFLTQQWRDGALFGAKAEEAFYVRIDEVLNPFSEQALGKLHLEIGVRPAYPAEFIIVRIGIWQGGAVVTEG